MSKQAGADTTGPARPLALAALDDAARAGLLDDATEHVSFRIPRALLDAARRGTGIASTTQLGLAALAMLAGPDPVSAAMQRTRGALGKAHELEY
jgi:hypothetical protein